MYSIVYIVPECVMQSTGVWECAVSVGLRASGLGYITQTEGGV